MTEFWEREYPWPDAPPPPAPRSLSVYNHQRVLDLGNGWRASLITETDWDAIYRDGRPVTAFEVWPYLPGQVEVGFLAPGDVGLEALELEWDDERIVAVGLPDRSRDAYCDSVARHLTLAQLDQLLPLMAAL